MGCGPPRRAALQGASGTGIFRAAQDSSPAPAGSRSGNTAACRRWPGSPSRAAGQTCAGHHAVSHATKGFARAPDGCSVFSGPRRLRTASPPAFRNPDRISRPSGGEFVARASRPLWHGRPAREEEIASLWRGRPARQERGVSFLRDSAAPPKSRHSRESGNPYCSGPKMDPRFRGGDDEGILIPSGAR